MDVLMAEFSFLVELYDLKALFLYFIPLPINALLTKAKLTD